MFLPKSSASGPSPLEFLELQSLATSLSAQNKNLQAIALEQKRLLTDKEQQIQHMNEYMSE